jgi:hypothetical protein
MIIRDEIAYPEPAEVKRTLGLFAAAVLAVPVVFTCLWPWIDLQLSADDQKAIRSVFLFMALAIAVPVLGFWLWTLSVYRRVVRAQQWPHPGASLIRPVPVLRGERARGRAWTLLALASLVAVMGVSASLYLYFGLGTRLERLLETRLQQSSSANKLLHVTHANGGRHAGCE